MNEIKLLKDIIEHNEKEISILRANVLRYVRAFNLLMEYFDSIADEEKPKVDKELKKLGL